MTALDHLRIAVIGGVLLFTVLETAFTLWRARARIGEALIGEDGPW